MNFNSQQLKQAILAALADADMVKILDCAMFKEKCVNDIIKECDIPHTTVYRKIKYLLDQGLLVCTRMAFTEDGKKFSLFKSVFKLLNVKYEYNNLVVEGEYNTDPIEKISQKLFSLE
jgi:predicted transcriptional regulator